MILGFLGKGGSGKSTLSARMVEYMHSLNKKVLAIDADYNMDLAHNLLTGSDIPEGFTYLGDSAHVDIRTHMHVSSNTPYMDIVLENDLDKNFFNIDPIDSFSNIYTREIRNNLFLMAVGEHSADVVHGKKCSHALGASLKVYLPFLKLETDQHAIVDEKAGIDSVGTGIPTGFNMSVIVLEPTVHGMKTAKQIAESLSVYQVPYIYVVNKVTSHTDLKHVEQVLGEKPIVEIPFGATIDDDAMEKIYTHCMNYIQTHGDLRYTQSVLKFKINKEYDK